MCLGSGWEGSVAWAVGEGKVGFWDFSIVFCVANFCIFTVLFVVVFLTFVALV